MNSQIQPSLGSYYGPATYCSNDLPTLPPSNRTGNLDGRLRTPLRRGHYAQLDAWQDIDSYLKPGAELYRDSFERTGETDLFINHQRWNFENFAAFLILAPFLKITCIVFWPWLFWMFAITGALHSAIRWVDQSISPNLGVAIDLAFVVSVFILAGLSGWFALGKRDRRKHYFLLTGAGFAIALIASLLTFQTSQYGLGLFVHCGIMALLVFMGWVGWDFLLERYLRLFKHDGSAFNRQTGMLSFARRWRKPFAAPFYEFDPVMEYRPDRYGGGGYALWLLHRYSDNKVFLGARVQSMGMRMKDCLAFWDTLQRYMDVSQPLPDLPILEQFRHLDPTTAEHDRKTGRAPRYWRDMKYEDWEKKGVGQRMRSIDTYPWQNKPCIVEARIEPTLGIEAYYRSQEAKGIHATPKGDDYDNIHRG
ncbi:hypothetical protein [Pseudomonas sp. ML96]|uniref:hypothetical protein n=1 Tax=Pseudomonas sp. ML96 TaxID=1523503 RepID=UPI000B00C168|nr:hypothetical protein [Pseudomonas sp. ML96]